MNSVHDMGGTHNLGPISPERNGPVFNTSWQGRVHALVIASPTRGNIDAGRHQRELIEGPRYLAMTYYERWFEALTQMLLKGGAVTEAELASGKPDKASTRGSPRLKAPDVTAALSTRGSYEREPGGPPAFAPGDKVRTRNAHPAGHTRLPRYARGRVGVIERVHGAHVFPDSHAHGRGEDSQPLYTVRFTAAELWGPSAAPNDSVSLDLWQPYLEGAP